VLDLDLDLDLDLLQASAEPGMKTVHK
jgi:hypothetical protein